MKWVRQFLQQRYLTRPLLRLSLVVFFTMACVCLGGPQFAQAGDLADRLARFPHWQAPPSLKAASGFLVYPSWFLGDWRVTSTLVDLAAPLAPDIVSPGFAEQKDYLNQPVEFDIRFIPEPPIKTFIEGPGPKPPIAMRAELGIVADQRFNSLSLATAMLGQKAVLSINIDPQDPTRQVTLLRGDRQLTSVISQRGVEQADPNHVITSELFQQVFRAQGQLYLNQVENTTAYERIASDLPQIEADQVTAIYLSPQDPKYFKAGNQPVALYRYHLMLNKLAS